ncbi:MAG: hypothetical protein JW815_06425 [Candidatus Bathyarchaeota archaeon]|nr:hypothetical protein [Candidatus Bathyarchaeum sp.]
MKKNTAITIGLMWLLLAFSFTQMIGVAIVNGNEASIIWAVNHSYPNDYETQATNYTCEVIYDYFDDNGAYERLENNYVEATESSAFYAEVENCEDNYSYATVFYKGHSCLPWGPCYEGGSAHYHYRLADNDGFEPETNQIWDNWIHDKLNNLVHGFVFLWSCFDDEMGGVVNFDHAYGFPASFFNRSDLSADAYAYLGSDNSDVCYIGFTNVSKNFVEPTGYGDPEYNYGDFCRTFYGYATSSSAYTIRLSLLYSSLITIGCSYSLSDLYQGYNVTINNVDYFSRQVVYGDANEDLPD